MKNNGHQIIIHPGVVELVEQDRVFVRVLAQSACSSCHARGACSISEVEEKRVEVRTDNPLAYKPGDQVTVRMKQSLGQKAVVLGYVLPLILLVISIVTLVTLLDNEGVAALLSILLLVPYYIILYFLRGRLKQHFSFSIYSGD
jgi:sigma-E factor negative regulatory protein RseC